jgi:hypothetical protein
LVRSGGDLAPSVKTLWPQDYVLWSGKQLKLYYHDLSIFEWVNSYICIVQNQTDPQTARYMMNHLKNLMEDAVFYGWEVVKQAHSVILTSLETGSLRWDQEFEMAERRRSAIIRASKGLDSNVYSASSNSNKGNGQNRFQNRQQFAGSGNSRNQSNMGKKVIKPCLYFNNNVCAKKGDHEENNVVYRHICNHCWANDHIIKECPFC